MLAARSFYILLQKNRALVVLKQNVVQDSVSLTLQKIPCPTYIQHEVTIAYQFSLCRAAGVEFLFCGTHNGKSAPQRQSSTRMPSHVRMDSKRCVHLPLQIPLPLAMRISRSVRVPLLYLIMWTILSQSSRAGAQTLLIRNSTDVQVSGLACVLYNVFVTKLCNCTVLLCGSFS